MTGNQKFWLYKRIFLHDVKIRFEMETVRLYGFYFVKVRPFAPPRGNKHLKWEKSVISLNMKTSF